MNETNAPHADGHHHNGSSITPPTETPKTPNAPKGDLRGVIGNLATMAAGLVTKVEELASLAKDLAQKPDGKVQDSAPAVGGGGQKAKQGPLSNNDLKTPTEHKGSENQR